MQAHGVTELRDLPDDLLNPLQLRVKRHAVGPGFLTRRTRRGRCQGHPLPGTSST